jgi:hypothetical protein
MRCPRFAKAIDASDSARIGGVRKVEDAPQFAGDQSVKRTEQR